MKKDTKSQSVPVRFSATEAQLAETMPRVVVAGAGFGGLWATRTLANEQVAVYLFDKHNYHTFLPLLYQVATAELEPGLIARSVRSLVRGQRNVCVAMTAVRHIDLNRQVIYSDGQSFPYDYLILALGSINLFFAVPGAEANCFTLKSMEEGIALRNHILRCIETASQMAVESAEARRRLLTFVIIGGGPTGVEYAGALAELLFQSLAKLASSPGCSGWRCISHSWSGFAIVLASCSTGPGTTFSTNARCDSSCPTRKAADDILVFQVPRRWYVGG